MTFLSTSCFFLQSEGGKWNIVLSFKGRLANLLMEHLGIWRTKPGPKWLLTLDIFALSSVLTKQH